MEFLVTASTTVAITDPTMLASASQQINEILGDQTLIDNVAHAARMAFSQGLSQRLSASGLSLTEKITVEIR